MNGDPQYDFYWLTTTALVYTMTKMDDAATAFLRKSDTHKAVHRDCNDTCEDYDEGILTPHIQASYKTITLMCTEVSRRYEADDSFPLFQYDHILWRALQRWKPELEEGLPMTAVMELEGIPQEPQEPQESLQ
jgi:hypothetical protein